jgi:hypothetical protein
MTLFSFFRPILDALSDGRVIRTSVEYALRVLGILCLLGGIYLLVEILKASFELPTEGTIGGLILAVIFIAAVLAVVQIFFYRAGTIRKLGESQFTVIPIFSILFRAFGEIYTTFGVAVAVGGCLFIWFTKENPLYLLGGIGRFFDPSLSPEGTFLGGLLFLIYGGLLSFVILIVFYFLAESVVVLVDVAKNIRLLVEGGVSRPGSEPTQQ